MRTYYRLTTQTLSRESPDGTVEVANYTMPRLTQSQAEFHVMRSSAEQDMKAELLRNLSTSGQAHFLDQLKRPTSILKYTENEGETDT